MLPGAYLAHKKVSAKNKIVQDAKEKSQKENPEELLLSDKSFAMACQSFPFKISRLTDVIFPIIYHYILTNCETCVSNFL